jgi:uncharacterized membrane protein YiaA
MIKKQKHHMTILYFDVDKYSFTMSFYLFLDSYASSEMREREKEIHIKAIFSLSLRAIYLFLLFSLCMGVSNRAIALHSRLLYPGAIILIMIFSLCTHRDSSLLLSLSYLKVHI